MQDILKTANIDVIHAWLDALYSGDYVQITNSLRNDNGYCCLGVLEDLYLRRHNEEWDITAEFGELIYQSDTCTVFPSDGCAEWLFGYDYPEDAVNKFWEFLSQLNDVNRASFQQIADVIAAEIEL